MLIALAAAGAAAAEEASVDLASKTRFIGEAHSLKNDSPFAPGLPLTGFGADRARFEEELRGRVGPVALLLTGTFSGQERQRANGKLLANEAFVDFGAGKNRFTIGKKILSGDVSYGFRPIDLIQREMRLQVLPPALEGIPNLAWERFTAEDAWSLFWTNPGHGRRGDSKHDGSLALRYYRRAGAADLHGVARVSERFGLEAGGAFSAVPHESLEVHASFLAQRRSERVAPLAEPASIAQLLSPDRALRAATVDSPRKALAGFTWTVESGWSLIAEIWWDGTAPTAGDWRDLARQAARRDALIGVPGVPFVAVSSSLAASTRLFAAPSVSRRSALAHLGWTDPAASGWSGALDLLRTLEDRGWSATAAVSYEADRLRLDAGLRRFGGRPDSAYGLLPEKNIVFAGASLAF